MTTSEYNLRDRASKALRFWPKVDRGAPDECWPWLAGRDTAGYGQFGVEVSPRKWKTQPAHRVAYELEIGPIPDGLTLDHLCRNRPCVNPAHLEAVTSRENILRGEGVAAQHARKTHCPQGHPYSGENLYVYPSGGRECRACHRESSRRYRLEAKGTA